MWSYLKPTNQHKISSFTSYFSRYSCVPSHLRFCVQVMVEAKEIVNDEENQFLKFFFSFFFCVHEHLHRCHAPSFNDSASPQIDQRVRIIQGEIESLLTIIQCKFFFIAFFQHQLECNDFIHVQSSDIKYVFCSLDLQSEFNILFNIYW